MDKAELIKRLEQISGNPIVHVWIQGEWVKAESVIGIWTRNGIGLIANDPAKIDYLGPVP